MVCRDMTRSYSPRANSSHTNTVMFPSAATIDCCLSLLSFGGFVMAEECEPVRDTVLIASVGVGCSRDMPLFVLCVALVVTPGSLGVVRIFFVGGRFVALTFFIEFRLTEDAA